MTLFNFLKSTILSKVVMAGTGVLLVSFIIGHTVGNMQMFLGRETFNHYAHFLQSLGELLWIIRIALFVALILHIITAIRLKFLNWGAKPVKYKIKRYVEAKLTARTMIWTGIMIFAFLSYHILHFTAGVTNPENYGHVEYYEGEALVHPQTGDYHKDHSHESGDIHKQDNHKVHDCTKPGKVIYTRHDVYYMVVKDFQQPILSILYIVGVILMGFHLSHAIQSMFQTLGIHGPRFTPQVRRYSNIISTLLVLCLISIPITIIFGLVGGCL